MIDDKSICICIPARYNSQRFPGKPLALIGETPMVIRVAQNMKNSKLADQVVILTDDERIKEVSENYGIDCLMTSKNHESGTERLTEFANKFDYDFFVNAQGDEPFVTGKDIDYFIQKSIENSANIATIINPIHTPEELFDFNVVKCVKNLKNFSIYFSRQAIPCQRGLPFEKWLEQSEYFRHSGIYFFSKDALKNIANLNQSELEKAEKLEQLKWLENDMKIYCINYNIDNFSIDTLEDLEKINKFPGN